MESQARTHGKGHEMEANATVKANGLRVEILVRDDDYQVYQVLHSDGQVGWGSQEAIVRDSDGLEPTFRVIADEQPWMDPDGHMAWPEKDAASLADHVESLGYTVTIQAV